MDTHDDVHREFPIVREDASSFCYRVRFADILVSPSDILRIFDMTSRYGPCVGVTRLQRWERAKKWGLNPPEEVRLASASLQSAGRCCTLRRWELTRVLRSILS